MTMHKLFLKGIFLVMFWSIVVFSCKQHEGDAISKRNVTISRQYHSNGQLKEVGALIDSLKYGYWITYNIDGGVDTECTYFNDSLRGSFILYYPNGNIKVKGYMDKGEWHGERLFYYSSGVIKNKGFYLNGKLHGLWEYYDQDGNLDKKIEYKEGEKNKVLLDNKLLPSFP